MKKVLFFAGAIITAGSVVAGILNFDKIQEFFAKSY